MVDDQGNVIPDGNSGFDWNGLSDFINSVEGPTLGVLALAKNGSVSDGSISAAAGGSNGSFAGPGAAGTGAAAALAAGVSSSVVSAGGFALTPGMILIGLALLLGGLAIAKS